MPAHTAIKQIKTINNRIISHDSLNEVGKFTGQYFFRNPLKNKLNFLLICLFREEGSENRTGIRGKGKGKW